MREWKKLLSLNLALCMILSLLPLGVWAAEEDEIIEPAVEEIIEPMADYGDEPDGGDPTPAIVASGICGANLTWVLDEDGTLTISGEGKMYDYESLTQPWYTYRSEILKVVIEDGVTSIGNDAFSWFGELIDIVLPKSVTAIGWCAFENCNSLKRVTVPGTVTDIGLWIFKGCKSLSEVKLEEGLVHLGTGIFEDCSSLKTVFWPSSLEKIDDDAFKNCGLVNLTIPDGVISISSEAFRNCTNLTLVTIGSGIKTIDSMAFAECTALETVIIDNFKSKVEVADDAFLGSTEIIFKENENDEGFPYTWEIGMNATATLYADGLLKIEGNGELTNFDEEGLEVPWSEYQDLIQTVSVADGITVLPSNIFYGCENLKNVTIGSGIVEIGYRAFYRCSSLESVNIDNYKIKVKLGSSAFPANAVVTYKELTGDVVLYTWEVGAYDETDATATLYGDGLLTIEGKGDVSNNPWSDYAEIITKVVIEKNITSLPNRSFSSSEALTYVDLGGVTTIENDTFMQCTALETVIGLENVIEVYDRAFRNCSALKCDFVGEEVEYIGYYAFAGSGIKSIDITGDDLLIDNNAFVDCENLKSVRIDGDVWEVGSKAFANCPNLTSVYWNAEVREDFYDTSNLFLNSGKNTDGMTVTFGPDVTEIPAYMFYTSSSYAGQEPKIVSVAAEGEIERIGAFAFYRCADLATVELGDSLQYIEDGAFNSCSALTAIDLPMGMQEIGAKTFFRSGLTEIGLGSEVAFIGENAFGECADGFLIRGFADSYAQEYAEANNIPFALFTNIGSLQLHDNHGHEDYIESLSGLIGDIVNLGRYSKAAQARYFAFASSANLVAWNTKADGSGTDYSTHDEITMEEAADLFGRWETMQFTIDDQSYPVDRKISGDGWSYDGADTLLLDGYDGGGIELPRGFYVKTYGDVVICDDHNGIVGTEDLHIEVVEGTLTIEVDMGDAIRSDDIELIAGGDVSLRTGDVTCIYANKVYITGAGTVEVQSEHIAVNYHKRFDVSKAYRIYTSADGEPAEWYQGENYIRLEADICTVALHANGGTWEDQDHAQKTFPVAKGETFELYEHGTRITRDGYILDGWTDLEDNVEYGPYDSIEAGDVTLYAQWIEEALVMDGVSYDIHTAHSGTGWSYTPATSKNAATLTITDGYTGGAVSCTETLTVQVNTSVILVGKTNLPAIKVYGDLKLNVAEGHTVSIYGGSGESAISSRGEVSINNYGDLSIYGGAGGLGVDTWTNLYSDGAMSIVGGLHSPAVDGLAIENCAGTITLVAGANANHAFDSWADAEGLAMKFYVGANASNAIRDDLYSAKYVRVQPKTIIVTLDANGGSFNSMALNTMEVAQDEDNSIILPEADRPVMYGYRFDGWNTKPDGSGLTYVEGETYMAEANVDTVVLYAQWIEKKCMISAVEEVDANTLNVTVCCKLGSIVTDLFIAVYDADGRMIGIKQAVDQVLAEKGTVYTVDFAGEAAEVKAFVSNDAGVPYDKAEETTIQ